MNDLNIDFKSKKKKEIGVGGLVLAFFVGLLSMFLISNAYPLNSIYKNEDGKIVYETKSVTVTDSGIADSVQKVYDASVVVTAYKDGKLSSTGTGFVFKKDKDLAYILTNDHVIASALSLGGKVSVTFTDDSIHEVNVVGSNQYDDIAVLSIDASKVKAVAKMGSSEKAKVGDTTFVIGAPMGTVYSWTVTRGILSGKDRLVEVSVANKNVVDYVMRVLQTDAAVNSGNSGGPLCNINGEVIGVVSLKVISSGVEGMGFAIPIEEALQYANKIMSGKGNSLPYLGLSMGDITADIASKYNVSSGVIVRFVETGSSADEGGLKKGDIITKLGNTKTKSTIYLRYALYRYNVGDKVEITFYRDNKEMKTEVVLKEAKS